MSDVEHAAASDAAVTETIAPETQTQGDDDSRVSVSAREALTRAMAKVQGQDSPAPQEDQPKSDRPRDEAGRFAKAEQQAQQPQIQPQAADQIKAPSRFAKAAQDAWAQTPEAVRQEAERAINELTQGIEKYRTDAETFNAIRKYHDLAVQSGTTLERALENYVGIETALRQNPLHGFLAISRNIGVDPAQYAAYVLQSLQAQTPGQMPYQLPQHVNPDIAALKQDVEFLRKEREQQQVHALESEINAFAEKHPHLEAVAGEIVTMLQTGYANSLPDAYAKAVRLNPDVAAKIAAEEQAAKAAKTPDPAQTREKATKSITGSPTSGSNPETRPVPGSAREALTRRFAELGIN